ncbi:MAG TPA: BolA/IbaG family iron-sulfur metabolism protein [Arsenophonus sp.]
MLVLGGSDQHNVPLGVESHFKVILVMEKFASQTMVVRHRAIY